MLLAAVLLTGTALPVTWADNPDTHASYGPPKEPPAEWAKGGQSAGIDGQGRWCILGEADNCRFNGAHSPDPRKIVGICEAADGTAAKNCSKESQKRFERGALEAWREKAASRKNFNELNAFLTKCVKSGRSFKLCLTEGTYKHPEPRPGVKDWIEAGAAQLVSDGLGKAAQYIGEGVVWLLRQFADEFAEVSTVNLEQTGIGRVLSIMTGLSAVIACFLLLLQFGKAALTQQGAPVAIGVIGLLKYAAVLSVYILAVQTFLYWTDELSDALITMSFEGNGGDPAAAMKQQLGQLFAGLVATGGGTAAAGALVTGGGVVANGVAFVIVVGIICIICICALWLEMMVRQAAIMITVVVMPVVLSGELMDATRSWWPRARDALIALILTKPVITLCFAIGFTAMTDGKGVKNVLVGLVCFLLAAFAWPVVATYMTFTTNGDGQSAASGMFSSLGSSISSMYGGQRALPSGAGAVGGGTGYTQALESDAPAPGGGNDGFWRARMSGRAHGGSFAARVGGSVGVGLQLANAGTDALAGTMANTAAHAGLGPREHLGRSVVIPPRRTPGEHKPAAPPPPPGETEAPRPTVPEEGE
ncbi:hypothetical protein SRB5_53190 [Streptomyces sp. RB5]|uniref:TrbL/VirB6 plasmid conjugal transfer protein n=2 Tax=Streptomyces smaragdinus TaxID=2585196 RepID=A0A7K0CP06_9ACTN|nr:hypothetical protein [Streptomyces smaragdinus]